MKSSSSLPPAPPKKTGGKRLASAKSTATTRSNGRTRVAKHANDEPREGASTPVAATKKERVRRGRKTRASSDSDGARKSRRTNAPVGDHDFGIVSDETHSSAQQDTLILHLRVIPKHVAGAANAKNDQATEQELLQYTPHINEPSPYESRVSESFPCPLRERAGTHASPEELESASLTTPTTPSTAPSLDDAGGAGRCTHDGSSIDPDQDASLDHSQRHAAPPGTGTGTAHHPRVPSSFNPTYHDSCECVTVCNDVTGEQSSMAIRQSRSGGDLPARSGAHANLTTFDEGGGGGGDPVGESGTTQSNESTAMATTRPFPVTDICCWWCCHPFQWSPFMIPIRKVGPVFHAIGCFCMPECAASYIFWSGTRNGDPCRQYSWLHEMVCKQAYGESCKIRHAPPREALKMFGGPYTIDEFRRRSNNYDVQIKITRPPVTPSNGVTEEMLVQNTGKKRYVPLDNKRIEKATEQLRLKRTKKKDAENTLENFMNLRIGS